MATFKQCDRCGYKSNDPAIRADWLHRGPFPFHTYTRNNGIETWDICNACDSDVKKAITRIPELAK